MTLYSVLVYGPEKAENQDWKNINKESRYVIIEMDEYDTIEEISEVAIDTARDEFGWKYPFVAYVSDIKRVW